MARSKRRTPIFGITTAESEQWDKRIANRRWRSAVRRALKFDADILPERREHSDPWIMAKDGKRWMAEWAREEPSAMRK
ncbi:conserved protein of unknown function（phage related&|uniref:hypothetical protein n=1 Tax=Magnetospirillum sp. XM-1 TaxID=1663591 RepID=UPI00073DFEA6|nr:hypothetical protein [Magnetospirillum sp. XM-1]CUW37142.1 conserved protein of unknown function\